MKCSYCYQSYAITNLYKLREYVPFILHCGHSICNLCITTVLRTSDAITCKTCKKVSELPAATAKELRSTKKYGDHFPIHMSFLGTLFYNHVIAVREQNKPEFPTSRVMYPAGISHPATRGLQKLAINRDVEKLKKALSTCERHPEKPLDLFCRNCDKAICVNCISICGTHTIVQLKTKNEECQANIAILMQGAKDVLHRVRRTTAELNMKLNRPRLPSFNEKVNSNPLADHFALLYARLHRMEKRLLKEYDDGKKTYSNILGQLTGISGQINTLIEFFQSNLTAEQKEHIDYNSFAKLLEPTVDFPWYLADSLVTDDTESSVSVEINNEIFNIVDSHCTVIVKSNEVELLPTSKLPPEVEVAPIDRSLDSSIPNTGPNLDTATPKLTASGTVRRMYNPPENKTIKSLFVGAVDHVIVTHINTPHDFYVQLTSVQPKLKELCEKFNKNAKQQNFLTPGVDDIVAGGLFLAYNDQDKQWDRVKLVSEDPPVNDTEKFYDVSFIDYGHTGKLTADKLRVLPPDEIPPLALNCRLVNCEPVSKTWTNNDSLAMLRLVSSCKVCLVNVVNINENCHNVILVTTPNNPAESNIYIADALIMLGKAVAGQPVYKNTKLNMMLPSQQCGFNKQILDKNDKVLICNTVSPSNFWVRKLQLSEFFLDVTKELEDTYSIESPIGSLYSYEIGMCVAVHDTEYGWCRGQVNKMPCEGQLKVLLVDYGVIKTVHWTALRKLLTNFLKIDQLTTFCQLANLKQFGEKWNEVATGYLIEHMTDSTPLKVKSAKAIKNVKKGQPFKMELLLHIHPDTELERSVDVDIVEKGLSSSQGDTEEMIPKYQIMKKSAEVQEQPKLSGILKLEVDILSAASPSDIYIGIKSQQTVMDKLSKDLEKFLKGTEPNKEATWNIDDTCAAFLNTTKTWHRAFVKEVLTDMASVRVFSKDTALIEVVPVENLRALDKKFAKIKDRAVKCHLSGIMPGAGTQWPNYTKEFCQDLLSQYDRFYITKTGPIDNKSIPVELWVYHVTPGDAVTPTLKDWLSVNNKILQQGLAIRDTTKVEVVDEIEKIPLNESNIESEKQTEPFKPIDNATIKVIENVSGDKEMSIPNELNLDMSQESIPPIFDDWIPSEPLPSKEFIGMPTFVTTDFIIYLHDVVHSSSTLEFLNSTLTYRFKNSKLMPFDMFWHPGQLCIAKWEVDDKYYRGRINNISTDNTVEVMFVDYGNTELCAISVLRKNIVMHHVPLQATKCRLIGLSPVEGLWSENVLDFVHQQIVEQQCLITVQGEAVDGIVPIKLKVKSIHDIGETLVSLGYATNDEITNPKSRFVKKSDIFVNDSIPSVMEDSPEVSGMDIPTMQVPTVEVPAMDTTGVIDWNEMNRREEMEILKCKEEVIIDDEDIIQQFVTYPIMQFPSDCDFFDCEVLNFTEDCELTVRILFSEHQMESHKARMTQIDDEMQSMANRQPVEKSILEGKPCIAQFSLDNLWYRAKILQYDPIDKKIKVNYVDFGNSEIVAADNVREIRPDWLKMPTQVISAKLNGVSVAESADLGDLKRNFRKICSDALFVRIIEFDEDDSLFIVDFTKDVAEPKLAYQNLIDAGVLVVDE